MSGKKVQIRKRRLIKDFSIGLMEVCTDEAAPEVATNKSMLARFVGLSGNETRTSQKWRDLIQAAKKSKIIGNKNPETGRFGSIKKRIECEGKQETNVSFVEHQKSEPADTTFENSGNDLYPKIPEEDLLNAEKQRQMMTPSPKPISKTAPLIQLNETSQKQNINVGPQNIVPAAVKLSPNASVKTPMMKSKSQAPRPKEITLQPKSLDINSGARSISIPISPTPSKKSNAIAPEVFSSVPTISEKMPPMMLQGNENAPCRDTSITVTPSPEKTMQAGRESASIEMTEVQSSNSEFHQMREAKYQSDATSVKMDGTKSSAKSKQKDVEKKEVAQEKKKQETHAAESTRPHEVEMQGNLNFSQFKMECETQKRGKDSPTSPSPKEKGWL